MRSVYLGAVLSVIVLAACNNNPSTPAQPLSTASDGGTGVCAPATCASLQTNCGMPSDGCGGRLSCGMCSGGQSCSAANVCVAPDGGLPDGGPGPTDGGVVDGGTPDGGVSEGGSTKWVQTFSRPAVGIDADNRGDIVVTNASHSLRKVDTDGRAVWSFEDADSILLGVFVEKNTSRFYAWGAQDVPRPPPAILVRYRPDASGRTVLSMDSDTSTRGPAAADAAGDWLYVNTQSYYGTNVFYSGVNGTSWNLAGGAFTGVQFRSAAIDPTGDVLIGAGVADRTMGEGRQIGVDGVSTPLVLKYDSAGHFLWLVELRGLNGSIGSVGTSALGTVVAAGTFNGTATFGSDTLSYEPGTRDSAAMLLVIEPNGSARFARQFDAGQRSGGPLIAVDPPGQVAIAFSVATCSETKVEKVNLAGEHLWTRTFAPVDCQGSVVTYGLTVSNHNVVISGGMSGSVDFGPGPVSASGFLVELAP